MVTVAQVAQVVGIVVGVLTILGAVKSTYNGYVRVILRGLLRVDELCHDVEAVYRTQEDLIDALIAVAYASQNDDVAMVDPTEIKKEFDKGEGPSRYLEDDPFVRGNSDD